MITSGLILIGLLWAVVKVGGILLKVLKGEGKGRKGSKKGNNDSSDKFGGGSGGGGGSSRGF
jgi:uncharacterized membrane protein YgcG